MKTITRLSRKSAILAIGMALLLAGCAAQRPVESTTAATAGAIQAPVPAAPAISAVTPSPAAANEARPEIPSRPPFAIENRPWLLINLPLSISVTPPHSRDSYLWFRTPDFRLDGYTGCNYLKADYDLSQGGLKIRNLTAGKLGCDMMTFEALLIQTLSEAAGWEVLEDGRLLLKNDTGFPIAVFRPGDR